jgi:hypothetical protein
MSARCELLRIAERLSPLWRRWLPRLRDAVSFGAQSLRVVGKLSLEGELFARVLSRGVELGAPSACARTSAAPASPVFAASSRLRGWSAWPGSLPYFGSPRRRPVRSSHQAGLIHHTSDGYNDLGPSDRAGAFGGRRALLSCP